MRLSSRLLLPSLFALALVGVIGCGEKSANTQSSAQAVSSVAASVAAPVEGTINVSPNDDRDYRTFTLENGLEVIVVSDKAAELAAVSLSVAAGSYQDPDAHLGLAHYLEHMLFLGNDKYPEANSLQKFVDLNGGAWNAYTATDHTNYFFQIKADKLSQALDNFAHYFIAPKFDPSYSDKERNAVNSEWSMGRTHDGWILQRVSGITANPKNPASRISVGNLETLKDTPESKLQDALHAFYERYYSANLMKLALVSNAPAAELEALVREHFAAVPNRNAERPVVTEPGITVAEQGEHIHVKTLRDLKTLQVVFPVADNSAQWRAKPNTYLENLISSEEPGTLGKVMREKGLAQSVSVWSDPERYGSDGVFAVNIVMTEKGLNARDEIIAAVFAYIDLIKKTGVQAPYYQELKAIAEKNFADLPKTQAFALAQELAANMLQLPARHVMDADYVFDSFHPAPIQAVLGQLTPERARIFHVNNTEKADTPIPFYEGAYRVEKFTEAELAKWKTLGESYTFALPALNDLFSEGKATVVESTLLRPKVLLSEKGVEAYLTHADVYREDKGVLTLELNQGAAVSSIDQYITAQIYVAVLNQHHMSLIDKAGRAGIEVGMTQSDVGALVLRLSGYTQKHAKLLDDLVADLKVLEISETEFAKAREGIVQGLNNLGKNPPYLQAIAQFQRFLRPQTAWSDEDLLAAAKKVTRDQVQAYHQLQLKDHLLRVYAFGNYDEAALLNMVKRARDELQSARDPSERVLAQFLPRTREQGVVSRDIEPTDNAMILAFVANSPSLKDALAMRLLAGVYGNSSFTELRTEEQLGYVVRGANSEVDERAVLFLMVQSNNTALVPLANRLNQFNREFSQVLADLSDEDFEQLRAADIAAITEKPTNFYAEAIRFMGDFSRARYSFDRRERELNALKALTKADLVRVYDALVGQQQGSTLVVQMRGTNFVKEPFAKPVLTTFEAAVPTAVAE